MDVILANKLSAVALQSLGFGLYVQIQILVVNLLLIFHITRRFCFAPSPLSIVSAAMIYAFDP